MKFWCSGGQKMDVINFLRIVNFILAFLPLPPAIYLTIKMRKEKTLIDTHIQRLNQFLCDVFNFITILNVINIITTFITVTQIFATNSYEGIVVNNVRLMLTGLILTFITWGFYLQSKK